METLALISLVSGAAGDPEGAFTPAAVAGLDRECAWGLSANLMPIVAKIDPIGGAFNFRLPPVPHTSFNLFKSTMKSNSSSKSAPRIGKETAALKNVHCIQRPPSRRGHQYSVS